MNVTTEESPVSPPADLPTDADAFWGSTPADLVVLPPGPAMELPVIDQLGAAPFKKPDKGGFPFLGFLASVYEHVSTTAAAELHVPAVVESAESDSVEAASEEILPPEVHQTDPIEERAE